MGHEETPENAAASSKANDEGGGTGDEEPVSVSELLAQDRGRLDASLRAASPKELRDLLRDPRIRARIEQALGDLDAGRVSDLNDLE